MEDFITQNALLGLMGALIMQYLKQAHWFALLNVPAGPSDHLQERINLAVSIVIAGLIQIGIHYTFHFDARTGQFDAAIAGSIAGVRAGAWEWAKQWLTQHGAYKGVIVMPEVLGEMRTLLQRINAGQLDGQSTK